MSSGLDVASIHLDFGTVAGAFGAGAVAGGCFNSVADKVAATDMAVTDVCIPALAQNCHSPSNVWCSTQGCTALI